jgi:DNA-binding transcriptional LysR family regulator
LTKQSRKTEQTRQGLRAFDLNLLVVLDALVEEKSVQRTADRIGLSQSATSHALDRLRKLLDDEILVRTASGMAPTPRALSLATPIRSALEDIERALAPVRFDPATAEGAFVIAVETYEAVVVVPQLVNEVRREAPGIELTVRSGGAEEIISALDHGTADIAIGRFRALPSRLMTCRLMQDRYVCIMREDHPMASDHLTLDQYLACPHLMVSMGGANEDDVDEALAAIDQRRRIMMRLPSVLAAAIALSKSDMIATLNRAAARDVRRVGALKIVQLPLDMPPKHFRLIWNRRFQDSPAHTWFRRKLVEIGKSIEVQLGEH